MLEPPRLIIVNLLLETLNFFFCISSLRFSGKVELMLTGMILYKVPSQGIIVVMVG